MASTNYLNPASFAPPVEGSLNGVEAGMLLSRRQRDYDELMKNQFLLQSMATQQAGADLYKNLQDVPMENLKRQNTIAELQAKQPYIADLASSKAESDLAANRFSSDITHGPDARKAQLSEFVSKIGKNDFDKLHRESQISQHIMEQMQAMEQAQPGSGAAWAKQMIEKQNKLGYNLDENLANPVVVKKMYPHIVELNAEFQRKMKETRLLEEGRNTRNKEDNQTRIQAANIAAAASRDNAKARLENKGRKVGKTAVENAFIAFDELKDIAAKHGTDSDVFKQAAEGVNSQLEAAFYTTPAGRQAQDEILFSKEGLRMTPEEKRAKMNERAAAWARDAMGKYRSGNKQPTPAQGSKPDPLGLR